MFLLERLTPSVGKKSEQLVSSDLRYAGFADVFV